MLQEKWLTLSEVIQRTNFSESEARRLIKTFGKYLSGRNFGDIIKYPPATPEVIILIGKLYQQGWSTDKIMEVLATTTKQKETRSLEDELNQEVENLLHLQSLFCHLMRFISDTIRDLSAEMAVLTERLLEAEGEVNKLRVGNQSCQDT